MEQPKNENVLNKSLDDLEFSTRTYTALKNAGITTLGDIIKQTQDYYGTLSGINNRGQKEIIDLVREQKLTFKQE